MVNRQLLLKASLLTLPLAACGQSEQPSSPSYGLSAARILPIDDGGGGVIQPPFPSPPEVPVDQPSQPQEPILLTPEQVRGTLPASALQLQVTGTVPAWAGGLLGPDRRFVAGALRAGEPFLLLSPVDFDPGGEGMAEHDADRAAQLQARLAEQGSAVLVPLLNQQGQVVGLLRLPQVQSLTASLERGADYALFSTPLAHLATPAEVAASAGVGTDQVRAVAQNANGAYDPYAFQWAVSSGGADARLIGAEVPSAFVQNPAGGTITSARATTQVGR